MGRGRALPSALETGPSAAKPSAPAPGALPQHPAGVASAAQQPAVNIGHQLLSQLQGQGITSTSATKTGQQLQVQGVVSDSGAKIGQQLLSQLQVQGSSSVSASQSAPNAGQQLLMQLQKQPAVGAPPAGAVLGQGLLQRLQSGAGAASHVLPEQATTGNALPAQTDAGQALLAHLQRPAVQSQQPVNSMAQPVAQPMAQPIAQPMAQPMAQRHQGPGAVNSFEQLLRGAAAAQRPMAHPMAEPAAQRQHQSNVASPSFNQLLQSAMAQQQPPRPPPGFARPPQPHSMTAATGLAGQAGSVLTHQPPSQLHSSAVAGLDPGRLLLQQLQGVGLGLQGGALGQQPQGMPTALSQQRQPQTNSSHPLGNNEAGQKLLQQLQRASLSEAANGDTPAMGPLPFASFGAAVDAPEPVPSAPPAPKAILLQNAAVMSASSQSSGED